MSYVIFCLISISTLSDALPRITTRSAPGRFVVANTNQIWTPRGLNYIRLNSSQGNDTNVQPVYHATFSIYYYNYTAVRIAAAHACSVLRFNFVRVFVDAGTFTRSDGINGPPHGSQTFDAGYVSRLVDFVSAFSAVGCYTMITLNGLPANTYWENAKGPAPAWCEYPQVSCALCQASRVRSDLIGLICFCLFSVTCLPQTL
jgi:hypothetical protein